MRVKKIFIMCASIVFLYSLISAAFTKAVAAQDTGEALFKQYCTMCHVDGGNIVNPQKTLHKKDREANNVKTAEDIVKTMRKPGPGMTMFDEKTIPDKDAKKIAEYILGTFNK